MINACQRNWFVMSFWHAQWGRPIRNRPRGSPLLLYPGIVLDPDRWKQIEAQDDMGFEMSKDILVAKMTFYQLER